MVENRQNDRRRSGTRTVCDLDLRSVNTVATPWADSLEPGDLVLFRGTDNWLSRLITSLDGYWSHSGIYIGGPRMSIAHAATGGVSEVPFDEIQAMYGAGVGIARPARSREQRAKAAAWAIELCEQGRDGHSTAYSGDDLGLAFGILLRARMRGGREKLPPAGDDDVDLDGATNEGMVPAFSSTCSGFVYQCYSEGAGEALTVEPAPGLLIEDGKLCFPEGPSLFDELFNNETDPGDPDLEALPRPDWGAWRDRARLVADAAASSTSVLLLQNDVELEKGVSPADLWCSPDIGDRWFLLEQHQTMALEATKDCG